MRFLGFLLLAGCLQAQSISTLIGTGSPGFNSSQVNNPYGLTMGPDGAIYFCDIDNHVVRRIDLKTRTVSTVAGSGKKGNSGDGGPAINAAMDQPYEVQFDKAGNLFVVDMPNHVVRRVDAKSSVISTVAGNGTAGFSGDGGPAVKAQFKQPHSIAFDPEGRLLICDIGNNRVRRVNLETGKIETWLGGEGQRLRGPRAMAFNAKGDLYLVLREGNVVLRVDAKTGAMMPVAGNGKKGWTGDGGPATEATLNGPKGISFGPDGAYYLADTENHVIRRVDGSSGVITTVAGSGKRGDGPGDGGDDSVGGADPRGCAMNRPHGVFVSKDGVLFIGDSEAHRIRMVK